jgi:hypothetical protein
MRIDQYRTEPNKTEDLLNWAAWMRMIVREAYEYQAGRETQRAVEQAIMDRPLDFNPGVVEQIRDHRENGNYTTCHR